MDSAGNRGKGPQMARTACKPAAAFELGSGRCLSNSTTVVEENGSSQPAEDSSGRGPGRSSGTGAGTPRTWSSAVMWEQYPDLDGHCSHICHGKAGFWHPVVLEEAEDHKGFWPCMRGQGLFSPGTSSQISIHGAAVIFRPELLWAGWAFQSAHLPVSSRRRCWNSLEMYLTSLLAQLVDSPARPLWEGYTRYGQMGHTM